MPSSELSYRVLRPRCLVQRTLELVETHEAASFLAQVAAVDLVWPSHRHLPVETAERAADRVVALLGPAATWWTNHDAECGAVNGLTPLFDSLLAGTVSTSHWPADRRRLRAPARQEGSSPSLRAGAWSLGKRCTYCCSSTLPTHSHISCDFSR